MIDGFSDVTAKDMAAVDGGLLGLAVRPGKREAGGDGRAGRAARVERDAVHRVPRHHAIAVRLVQTDK